MTWEPAEFLIATPRGPEKTPGYIYRDLGLHRTNPLAKRAVWSLTHLGTGHQICTIQGVVAKAFPLATGIADLGDWSWDGFAGYKNCDPDLPGRVLAFLASNPACKRRLAGATYQNYEDVARQIAMARA